MSSAAFGAALAALVAADAPALRTLKICNNHLGDDGLAPVVDALRSNHYLRELEIYNTGMSVAFARDRLLPAGRANTSLRELCSFPAWMTREDMHLMPAALEAEALVNSLPRYD